MLKSLWIKFLILLLFISAISLSAVFLLRELMVKDFSEYLEGEKEDRIYKILAAIEGSYEEYSGWDETELRDNAIWALLLGYEIKIVDEHEKEIINNVEAVDSLSPLMKRRILAISGFASAAQPDGEEFMSYPLFLGGKNIGDIRIRSISPVAKQAKQTIFLTRSNRFLVLSVFLMGGLSVLLSLVFSRKLTEPIKKLTHAVQNVSNGNIKSRVRVQGDDEISNLAKTFNTMSETLERQHALRRKLTSNIAHELRTPLTAIQGELEGMMDGLINIDRERLFSLHEETVRLKKIIEGIEELSRAEASVLDLKRHPIDLKPFLNAITERFEHLFLEKGVHLEFECNDNIILHANPDSISRIVINLLSNALKASTRGGIVSVRAGQTEKEIFLEVKDTGCGIKKEDMPFVFERFYKASEGGLGLGLTISKELAEAHGGRIEVESEYGKGASFTLYLPNS
ncbi:MAG: ATP-binding protein [Nitrospirota bacterium]